MIDKCNIILHPLGIYFTKVSDMLNEKCIIALLHILTDFKVQINTKINDFSEITKQSKVPLVINESTIDSQNHFLYLIQIQIIFDFFSDKIDKISQSSLITQEEDIDIELSVKDYSDFTDSDEDIQLYENLYPTQTSLLKRRSDLLTDQTQQQLQNLEKRIKDEKLQELERQKKFHSKSFIIDISKDEKEALNFNLDDMYEISLLKTINAIGKIKNLHFSSIIEAVLNDNPLKFVKIFIKQDKQFDKQMKSTAGRIDDIIEYLRGKVSIFSFLMFTFNNPRYTSSSAVSFYTHFLNIFFLKQTKQELLERCTTIIFDSLEKDDFFFKKWNILKMQKKDPYKETKVLFKWETYLALVYILNERNTHFKNKGNEDYTKYFKQKNIPIIIDNNFLQKLHHHENNAIYYQLQFIFNVYDQDNFFQLREIFLAKKRLIQKVKVQNSIF